MRDEMRVLGVVAAAGRSGRMGAPKALLSTRRFDPEGVDEPWARRVARMLRDGGATDIVVTVPDDEAVAAAVDAAVADVAVTAKNPQPHLGLSGSLFAALDVVEGPVDALLVCPVDAPGLQAAMVRALADAVAAGADAAVVVHAGRRGHPVAFASRCFTALRSAGERGGPRAVLADLDVTGGVVEIAVDDDAVLWDLNSPEALARLAR
jgi:molybdenum cofactor cytidylyltransferase